MSGDKQVLIELVAPFVMKRDEMPVWPRFGSETEQFAMKKFITSTVIVCFCFALVPSRFHANADEAIFSADGQCDALLAEIKTREDVTHVDGAKIGAVSFAFKFAENIEEKIKLVCTMEYYASYNESSYIILGIMYNTMYK